jgi:hypothetical protein
MADSNNIPQEAEQLAEALNSDDKNTQKAAKSEVANTNFDKEYQIAQENSNGSGTQSSDPGAMVREAVMSNDSDSQPSMAGQGANQAANQTPSDSTDQPVGQTTNSPGDSDPKDYLDMAKDILQNVDTAAK